MLCGGCPLQWMFWLAVTHLIARSLCVSWTTYRYCCAVYGSVTCTHVAPTTVDGFPADHRTACQTWQETAQTAWSHGMRRFAARSMSRSRSDRHTTPLIYQTTAPTVPGTSQHARIQRGKATALPWGSQKADIRLSWVRLCPDNQLPSSQLSTYVPQPIGLGKLGLGSASSFKQIPYSRFEATIRYLV